ncbi:MAG TPA: class I SAM-dependent methyltransferase [Puia sp.]|nr:class I SAM-dependent methyltransferase [Puia sp.]
MKDVLGEALSDYHYHLSPGKLWIRNKYGPREEMPVHVYFRQADDMPELEWIALQQCRGKILDIGAGAGSHALVLQQMDHDITALDNSPKAAAIMEGRGVKKIIRQDFFDLPDPVPTARMPSVQEEPGSFDTLLLMMNGIGLAGTLTGLRHFLAKARKLIRPGGQLLFDSSDIAYMYEGNIPEMEDYYGEILYQYEYKRQRGDWFKWLFIDKSRLAGIAAEEGWSTRLLFEDGYDQYLVSCTINSDQVL